MKQMTTAAMREANGGIGWYKVYCPCGNVSSAFTKNGAFAKHYAHQKKYIYKGVLGGTHRGLWTNW